MGDTIAAGLNRAFRLAPMLLGTLISALPAVSRAAPLGKVVEDVPGRLVLDVIVPAFSLAPSGDGSAQKVTCVGCQSASQSGAPDVPAYRFAVLSGPSAPSVNLAILESETRVLAGGIAPFPHYLSPTRMEYRRDESAFARGGAAAARVLDSHILRGAPVRGVQVPLALWDEGRHTLTLIKRMRVQIEFPGVLTRPAPSLEPLMRREVKNPVGGLWLYASQRTARQTVVGAGGKALGKLAGTSGSLARKTAAPVVTSVGDTLIRFKVRNKSVESLSEDGYYAIAFSSLPSEVSRAMQGRKLRWMRLLTGINDTLPLSMDSAGSLPGRLHEIPMETVDADQDSIFGPGDSLKFFAHGTNIWKRIENPGTNIRYEYSNDPYSFDNYYYLDFGASGQNGLRLAPTPTPAQAGTPLTSSPYFLHAERDLETANCDLSTNKDLETGPDWHWIWKGDCNTSPDVDLTPRALASEETAILPNKDGDTVLFGLYANPRNAVFQVKYQGNILEAYPDSISQGYWFFWAGGLPSSGAFIPENVHWQGVSRRFEGYSIIYRRTHVLASGQPTWIFPTETGKAVSYRVQGGEGASCARIVDGEASALLLLDGNGVFTDSLPPGANARYLVFRSPAAPTAVAIDVQTLPNAGPKSPIRDLSNCDGIATDKLPEYIIVTNQTLLEQALELRNYRDSAGRVIRVRAAVVTVEDIYRQFSGGRLSPVAIRDFLRYAYNGWDRGSSGAGALKYVVLFGDGNYDYRNIRGAARGASANIVPPFEYVIPNGFSNSDDQVASDDFYGIFEPGPFVFEGRSLSLAVGRIPVQSPDEASGYLAKLRAYEDPKQAGEWRAHIVLAADDNLQRGSDDNLDPIYNGHTTDTDLLGKLIQSNEKGDALDKVYLLDYPLNSAWHKPQAAQDLLTLINRGAVAINYVGHGATNQWADEVLLQTNDAVARMRNEGRTGMVNSFSCTVGRFESLLGEGMSEQFVKQKSIGAIGSVSATRESYPDPNLKLAGEFYQRAFPQDDSAVVTVGEALQYAKDATISNGQTQDVNNLKYGLLGDPMLLLRKPPLAIALTQVMDTIRALDCGTLRGHVSGGTGKGKINLKVVAGSIHKVYTNLGANHRDQIADKRGNILFEGTVNYVNGDFSAQYFIPKQISFGDTNAMVQAFAWDDSLEREGTTAVLGLHIQGTSTSSCASNDDGKGPQIRITGCENKETGGLDFPEHVKLALPYCLQIDVSDNAGGVISAEGPDEGTTVEIPGTLDPFHPQPGIDDLFHKTYQISLDPKVIRPGNHLLKVSARDGYGNYSARQMQMDVTLDSSLVSIRAYNHPNPMKRNGTTFYFATGMPAAELEFGDNPDAGLPRLSFEVRIFNQAGRLVKVLRKVVSGEAHWDGRDEWGTPLANGVYFYKVTATQVILDTGDRPGYSTVTSKFNTLVLSR
jgi:hypothetical protein